jgi:hypothetical protein
MSLLSALVVGFVLGLLLGGRPRNLNRLTLRWNWLVLASLAVQLFLFTGLNLAAGAVTVLYLLSGALGVAWLAANLRVPGIACVLAGAVSNFLAIGLNGGRMPIDPGALTQTRGAAYVRDLAAGHLTSNSVLIDSHTRLPWLTDLILVPRPWPLPTVLSIGDVLIGVGVIWLIAAGMRRQEIRETDRKERVAA